MPKPDLIHIIFNGGQSDESQGIVSLRKKKTWLFYTWGSFSGHHANGEAGVVTLGIADSDFKLLMTSDDDSNSYHERANWDHVVELLTCPAFRLRERLGEEEFVPIELLVVVRGRATQQWVSKLEGIVGHTASNVSRIGGNTDVLFHERTEADARKLAARLKKLKFVESVATNCPEQ